MLLGSATRENGVLRLMKALRHESPGVAETAKRLGASSQKDALAYVFKTMHLQHGGKLSLTRLLAGHLDDGATLQSSSGESGRVSGILAVSGAHDSKRPRRKPATPSRSASSTRSRPATRCRAARPRQPRWSRSSRCRRCWRCRSRQPTARTTSSSARRCCGSTRRIPR